MLHVNGCSGSDTQSSDAQKSREEMARDFEKMQNNAERRALDRFLTGLNFEMKGDYQAAVREYTTAKLFDPAAGIFFALGRSYFFLNNLAEASKNTKKAISIDSSTIEYYELLAQIYSKAFYPDSTASVLNKIIAMDSSRISAYYQLAIVYEKERPGKAIDIYNNLLNTIGDDWTLLLHIAELYERLGDKENVINVVNRLLILDPSNASMQKVLIDIYLKDEDYDNALKVSEDILKFYPDDIGARQRKAEVLTMLEKYGEAVAEYQILFRRDDVPYESKVSIGSVFYAESFNDSTLLPLSKTLFETIPYDSTRWAVDLYLGVIAVREGREDDAIERLNRAIEQAPWNIQAWLQVGSLHFDNGKYDAAILVMERALERFPEDFYVNFLIGLSYSQQGDHEIAKIYLEKAVALESYEVNALAALGYTLSQLGNDSAAVEHLERALLIEPDNVDIMGTLGLIYDDLEEYEKCDSIYSAALAIDSLNALVNNNYAYSLATRQEKLEDALRMAKIAVELEPENGNYLDTIAWVYFMLGDYDKAKIYIEKALALNSSSSVVLEHYGDILFKLGKTDEAIDQWQQASELDPGKESIRNKIERGSL
jgi:tetratricopeptide (TPR) repeat protein